MKPARFFLVTCAIGWACLWLSACRHATMAPFSAQEEKRADSLLHLISSTDSLLKQKELFRQAGNREGEMMAWRHLGRKYREDDHFIKAIEAHTSEYQLADALTDTAGMIQALNNIGTCQRRMSLLDEASRYHYHALRLCEAFSDKQSHTARKNRVVSLNGIGNIALRVGDDETADSVFRAALAGEAQLNSALGQAINYANLGAIFEKKGLTDSAWVYYRQSMKMNQQAQSALGIALCHGHFGDLFLKEGETEKAIAQYEKAYQMKGQIDTWHWLNSCLALAKVYISRHQHQPALDLLAQAEKASYEGKAMDHLADVHALYYEIHLCTGNATRALEAYKQSCIYRDSIVNHEKMLVLQNERARYEYERRQGEIDSIRADYEREKRIRNIFALVIGVIVALAVIIYLQMRNTLRMKEKEKQLLKQVEGMRTSFFTQITHEFRTPLTVIIGLGEKVKDNLPMDEEGYNWPAMGEMIVRQGENILNLINQILEIAKVKSAFEQKPYKHGDIVQFMAPTIDYARQLADEKGIKVLFVPQTFKLDMDFVPDYINKIMGNLLSNAVKFAPEEGHIYIRLTDNGHKLNIHVSDDGCGIEPEELPFIFDTFYQGKNGKEVLGTGIGLALAKQLVEAMNGTIEVKSTPGEGSEFIITLPLKQPGGEWEELGSEKETANTPSANNRQALQEEEEEANFMEEKEIPRILLVEDNPDIVRYIKLILPHAHLLLAKNGQEGAEKAMQMMPDLIITDIMMPVMDGLEMCQLIRQTESTRQIPIIIITAKASEEDKLEGLKAGADAYLTKPFSEEELNITVMALLERSHTMRQNAERDNMIKEGTKGDTSSNDQQFLSSVIDLIHSQMQLQQVNINDIATALYIGPKQLNRRIYAITGENISRFVLKVRMIKAKQLLDSDKGYSIAQVAQKCGYDENSNFTRAFKLYYDLTPTQYRKANILNQEKA